MIKVTVRFLERIRIISEELVIVLIEKLCLYRNLNNDGQISFVKRSNLLSYKTIELLTINLNLMTSSCILYNNDYFH